MTKPAGKYSPAPSLKTEVPTKALPQSVLLPSEVVTLALLCATSMALQSPVSLRRESSTCRAPLASATLVGIAAQPLLCTIGVGVSSVTGGTIYPHPVAASPRTMTAASVLRKLMLQ